MTEAVRRVKSIVSAMQKRQHDPMVNPKRLTLIYIGLLGLASCGPLPVYYRVGANVAQLQTDTLSCEVKALKEAPVANEIRHRPPVFYPGGQYCSGGNCWSRPGYWVDGGTYTVDVNLGLRNRLEQSCMANRGYQLIDLPRCSQQQIAAYLSQPGSQTTRGKQPKLSETSCALRLKDGTTRILSPL